MSASQVSPPLLELLRCPLCGLVFTSNGAELTCASGHVFPVVRGIPRLVPEASLDSGQSRTAAAFGYSWTHYPKQNPYTPEQWSDWVYPLEASDFEGKVVLDAGCGLGGFAEYARAWGAARVVGIDLSSAVDAAAERLGGSVDVVQGDLFALPIADGSFDLAYSIGVLHHLPDPERGFRSLASAVKPGGLVFAWVYGRENNGFIVRVVDPFRRHVFSRLPRGLLKWGVSLPLAALLWPVVKAAGRNVGVPYAAYFRFLAQRDFAFTHGVVFDQLVAPTTHYIRREELEGWFERAGLVDVVITWRNRNSWRGLGRVPERSRATSESSEPSG
jgi:SAM-dependent methyltransferase